MMSDLFQTSKTLAFVTVIFLTVFLCFSTYLMPFSWLLIHFVVIAFFIWYGRIAINQIQALGEQRFSKYLLSRSTIVFGVALLVLNFFFWAYNGSFFEPNSADSQIYHVHGKALAIRFAALNFDISSYYIDNEFDDYGYGTFLGMLHLIFGPNLFWSKIANFILAILSVRKIQKLAQVTFGFESSKIASIFFLLSPFYWLFISFNLKEVLMIYLTINALYFFLISVSYKFQFRSLFWAVFFLCSLFFFRTALGLAALLAMFIHLVLNIPKTKGRFHLFLISTVMLGALLLFFFYQVGVVERAIFHLDQSVSGNQFVSELNGKAANMDNVSLNQLLLAPFVFFAIILAPFPTFTLVNDQVLIAWFLSAFFIKAMLMLYFILGLLSLKRHNFRGAIVLLSFIFIYLLILAIAAQTTSGRLQLVAYPFMLIIAAEGFVKSKLNNFRWILYMLLLLVITLVWNYFKLSIRGYI